MINYVPVFIVSIIFILLINFILSHYKGGVSRNLLNIFINFTFIIYLFITPTVYYYTKQYFAFQMDVKDYFGFGFLQIFLHLFCYNFGYFLFHKNRREVIKYSNLDRRTDYGVKNEKKIFIFFIIIYTALFLNTLFVGINLVDVLFGRYGDPTLGLKGGSYYIQNLADSLITLIVLSYFLKIKKSLFLIILFLSLPLFVVLGFRYRILLTFFGIFLVYIYDNKINFKSFLKYISIGLIAFYLMLLFTVNRSAIFMQKFDTITYDISDFNFDEVFAQSRGSLMDFAVYKHIDNNHASIDYGETMFGYIFIKMIPASLFTGGIKPYPPPQFPIIDDAINGTRDNGEAVTCLGGAFIAFYYPGIYIFAFLIGLIVAKLQNRFEKSSLSMISSLIVTLVLFQWITRGYFPQVIDHLAYMLFPILLLKYSTKKLRLKSSHH
jgi:oligosaccharide repeat unit polymerase